MNAITQETVLAPVFLDFVLTEIQVEENGAIFTLEYRFKHVSDARMECFIPLVQSTQTYIHNDGLDPQDDVDVEIESMFAPDNSLATILCADGVTAKEDQQFMLTSDQAFKLNQLLEEHFEYAYERQLERRAEEIYG